MTALERKMFLSGKVCELVPNFNKEEIRKLREEMGMTRWEFSTQVGIPTDTIASWELGRRKPSHSARVILNNLQCQLRETHQSHSLEGQ